MSRYIDRDELYKALSLWDWQDLYLPSHFKELVDEIPTVDGGYTEQNVRDAYNDGFSMGVQRGYEDAVRNYRHLISERKRGEWIEKDLDNFRKYEVVCSECSSRYVGNYDAYDEPYDFNFCPNCGADMRGDKNDTRS